MAHGGHLLLDPSLVGLLPSLVPPIDTLPSLVSGAASGAPSDRHAFADEETEAPGGAAAWAPQEEAELPSRTAVVFSRATSHCRALEEGVSVCTGPTASSQVPGIGKTLSLFIHYQVYEAPRTRTSPPCPQDQQSGQGMAVQFKTEGVNVSKGPVPPVGGSPVGVDYHCHSSDG